MAPICTAYITLKLESSDKMQNNSSDDNDDVIKSKQEILAALSDDERESILSLVGNIDDDELSVDSLRLIIDEYRLTGQLDSGLILVARQNADLRDQVKVERNRTTKSLALNVVLVILLCILAYGLIVFPKYSTVQTVDNSVICEVSPEDNPMLTDAAIQDFAKMAVLSSYSFDYINYKESIDSATTRYFTSEGRTAFNKALKNSGSLAYIINNQLIMRSMTIATPQIEEKGKSNSGAPYWIVRMPITTEFYTGDTKPADTQSFVAQVRIVITKRDALNPRGLGVYSLTLRPYKQ